MERERQARADEAKARMRELEAAADRAHESKLEKQAKVRKASIHNLTRLSSIGGAAGQSAAARQQAMMETLALVPPDRYPSC